MPQGWSPLAPDQRTFALQVSRLLDDLNRPDLQNFATQYLQDAMRYYQRKAFFFNETDNTLVPQWAANTYYTQGATLQVPPPAVIPFPVIAPPAWVPSNTYAVGAQITDDNGNLQQVVIAGFSGTVTPTWATGGFQQTPDNTVVWELVNLPGASVLAVVNLTAGTSGATPPPFTQTIYTVPSGLTSPPVFTPTIGTTPDGTCLWATVAIWPGPGIYTQLSTVPSQNQYVPPLDYVVPRRVEVTWSGNLRIAMTWLSYDELRDYDVIRPTPPTTYPSWWTFWQQQIYVWPYPVGFYGITLSYRTAPPLPVNASDSNFWTTTSEALIRYWAAARITEVVLQDPEAAQNYYTLAQQELQTLTSQRLQQQAGEGNGIPPAPW